VVFPSPALTFPQKAAVIIDGGYWRKVQESLQIATLDFRAFTDALCDPAYRVRTFFFDGKTQANQSFHDNLRLLDRFEVILGDVVPKTIHCPNCDKNFNLETQKRVDVALAVELVHLATAKHVDIIVLVAGDRDFLPAVVAAKHEGVIVRLIHGPNNTVSEQLYQIVDERIEITRKYLESMKVQFGGASIDLQRSKIREPSEKNNLSQISSNEVYQMLARILDKNTKKTGQSKMTGPDLGQMLRNEASDWAKKYHVKRLRDLVALVNDRVKWEESGGKDYISLIGSADRIEPELAGSPIRRFLLDALKTAMEYNPNQTTLSGPYYGQVLRKMDKNWKKTYGVKSLTEALNVIKEKVSCSGSGPSLRITLKS